MFTVKYEDVFEDAHDEALDLIWDSCYQKALDAVFETPLHDSVYHKAYDYALKSFPEEDEVLTEEYFDSIYKPLIDKEIDSALKLEIESAKNGSEFEEAFRKSIHSMFEDTLLCTMEKTYGIMVDSMYKEELEKTYQALMDWIQSR